MIVHYRIPAPKTHSKAYRQQFHLWPHIKRPDGDNLDKFLFDSLNGILWEDDCLISWIVRSKSITWKKEGEIILYVREIDNTKQDYQLLMKEIAENIQIEAA